jgi:hypothetical protein
MIRTRLLLVLAGLLLLYPLFALRPYVTTKPYDVDESLQSLLCHPSDCRRASTRHRR